MVILLDVADASAGQLMTCRILAAGFIPFVICQSNDRKTIRTPLLKFKEVEEKQFCPNLWKIQKEKKKEKKVNL